MIARFRSSELSWGSPVVAAALAVLLGVAGGVLVVATSPVVVLAALAGLGVAFALLQSLQLGLLFLFALLVLLPFAVIPVNLGAQLTVLDATLTTLLLVWLLRLLARREALDLTPAGGLLLGFLGLAVAAFVNGSAVGLSPEMVRRFLKIINSTLLFFTIANAVRDWSDLRRIVRALVLSGGLAALIGIVLYFLPRSLTVQLLSSLRVVGYPSGSEVLRFLPGPNDTYTDTLRATGTSIDPNVLGGTLILVGALIAAQWFARRPVLPRPALAVVGLLVLACMVLTYSRSSWVGLAAAVAWLGTFRFRRAWLLGFGIVTALSVLPIGQEMLERLLSGLAGADKAAGMRLGEYKDALRLIARYPVLGVGFGGSPDVDLYVAVSSIYLLIAEQMGLLGLAAFLAVLAAIMVHATRGLLAATDPELKTALSGFQAALVGALVAGLFDHYFLNLAFPHSVALFWGYAALLLVAVRLARPNRAG